jgi:methionyl-tRNA formyltransferase
VTLRLVFFGTGPFAVASLQTLLKAGRRPELVVTQPDRPHGRGQEVSAGPLKQLALDEGLALYQPESMKDPAALQRLKEAQADLACVVSFGQILPQAVIDAPRLGSINVHGSLLPRWRGAAPIEWALAAGDSVTGVSIQRMVFKLDAGDVLLSAPLAVAPGDDAGTLHAKLAALGADLLLAAVEGMEADGLTPRPQDEAAVTYAPLIKKEHGRLDFNLDAPSLLNRFRAFKVRPGATVGDLKVLAMAPGPDAPEQAPGTLLAIDEQKGLRVACKGGSVWLEMVQAPGGKPMPGAAYSRGHGLAAGQSLAAPAGA